VIIATHRNVPLTCNASEPPIGIEPMTYALRVACCPPAHALPAPIARIIALTAPTTLGLSGTPFHEPFHGRGAADSEGRPLIGVIIDRQGSDAGVGRCGAARSPAQMGSESGYLQ
jgi:hypothetical protein